MKKEKFYVLAAGLCCIQFMGIAQDTLKTSQLPEVLVAASRTEKNPNDVSRGISLISAEEIKNSGAQSVEQLLNQVAGIYIVGAEQNPGMTGSIFLRGSNSNQTVLMIDGVRITDPSAINNAIDLSEMSLLDIDHIEVVKGAHSTLYGSSAIGGVVNIVTRRPAKEGISSSVGFTAGTFGNSSSQFMEDLSVQYALKNGLYLGASLNNTDVQGQNATVDTITNPATFQHPDKSDDSRKMDWSFKAGYQHDKFDLNLNFRQTHQLTDIDKGAYKDDDNYIIDFRRNLLSYGLNYKFNEKAKLQLIGEYSEMGRIETDDSSKVDNSGNFDKTYVQNKHKGRVLSDDLVFSYAVKSSEFLAGVGFYQEQMSAENQLYYYNAWGFPPAYVDMRSDLDSVNPHSTTINGFIHADLNGSLISPKMKSFGLATGLRYSHHSLFGSNTTFEVNPYVKLPEGAMIYGMYATGYNAPSLYQLYDPTIYKTWDTNYSTGLSRGDRKLKPETSQTIELGFKQSFGKIQWNVSCFKTVVDNAIEYVYLWDKNTGIDTLGQNWSRDDYRGDTYINIGQMTTEGIELGINARINECLVVGANLSYLQGKLEYSPENIDTAQTGGNHVQVFGNGAFITKDVQTQGLTRRPSTANVFISYSPAKFLTLRVDGRYAGARMDVQYDATLGPYGALATVPVNAYGLMDVSAKVVLFKKFNAILRVNNVLNEKYSEINGFTTRGRAFYLTLKYSI